MRGIRRGGLWLGLGSMAIQLLGLAARGADEPAQQAQAGYGSPREAFEARRKALAARDWRTSFASSTPAIQDLEIEILVRCWFLEESRGEAGPFGDAGPGEAERRAGKDRLRAAMRKHGLAFSSFAGLALLLGEDRFIKNMASRVADKAAFYEEASEILRPAGREAPELIHDFGDLQGVAEAGDSARGWVVWSRKPAPESLRLLRTFRRVDGRWFNDSETWDYTHRGAEPAQRAQAGYGSPREAFEARRKALAGRDWRTSFASSTPAAQDLEIENLVGCWVLMEGGLVAGPFAGGEIEEAASWARKARFLAFMKKNGVKVPRFAFDNDQLIEAIKGMASRIPDKAAFYEEASEALRSAGQEAPDRVYEFGDLQGVEEAGDTARGWVVWNRDHVYENGVKKVSRTVRLLRTFRRVDGRWFHDNETWDYTPFDPEDVKK